MKLPFQSSKIKFVLLGGGMYLLWLLIYHLFIKEHTSWDFWLNYNIVVMAKNFFDVFGVETFLEIESNHVVLIKDLSLHKGVWVGDNCNGFKLFSIFSIFILAFPGDRSSKGWFIPLGLVLIHLANIIRVMALLLINDYNPAYLDFNHNYTFTIFVYGIIFLLWLYWIKRYGEKQRDEA